jgi:transcriptional regulator with XRE-family HTH domain
MKILKGLAKARKAKNLSQRALAKILKTNQSNVSQWENGITRAFPHTVAKIARALRCRQCQLL